MGFKTEFNWVLKLGEDQGLAASLEKGKAYSFTKQGNRIYPIGIPIDLVDKNWNVKAKVIVEEFTNSENMTTGIYRIVKIYSEKEKELLGKYWKEIRETAGK